VKQNIGRTIVGSATAGVLALTIAFAVSGCSSPAPESTAPPGAATPAPAAPAGGTAPAAPVERRSAPGAAATPAGSAASPAAGSSAATPAQPPAAPEPPPPPPPPPPRTYTLKEGRTVAVYTTTSLSTKTNQSGEKFSATLAEPIVDGDWVIAKKGAHVEGVVVESDPGGKVKEVASIAVTLDSLTLADGRSVRLSASQVLRQAKTTKGKDAKKIGIGAGVGAAIGAIAGGGKAAAIGAGVGGAAGTGAVLATHGDPAVISAETRLSFTLRSPVKITEQRPR
jgi:hypothetical protein